MIVKLLTEHLFEFLSLTGGCRGSSESTLIKTSNCWKSHAAAHIILTMTGLNLPKLPTFFTFSSQAVVYCEHYLFRHIYLDMIVSLEC